MRYPDVVAYPVELEAALLFIGGQVKTATGREVQLVTVSPVHAAAVASLSGYCIAIDPECPPGRIYAR